jgi:hypothetical protein
MTLSSTLARVAALKSAPMSDLRRMWEQLFHQPAPQFNRQFLESRLAYRIQELALGGLKRETIRRLERLGDELDGGKKLVRKRRLDNRPVAGTRLIREWKGVTHEVTVADDHFVYQGKPYKSLSSIAKEITDTNRNGWAFFGLQSSRGG